MPFYKYVANRILTLFQNLLLGMKLSEYHTGYRAFSRRAIKRLPLSENSHYFVFDNQILAQAIFFEYRIGEISCPAKYFKETSSINFLRSTIYGFGAIKTSILFVLTKLGILKARIFSSYGTRLMDKKLILHNSGFYYNLRLPAFSPVLN